MRKITVAGLAVACLFSASAAFAQDAEKMNLGVDGAFLLPVGDLSDATGFMIGGLARLEYPASPGLAVTGRVGYLYGLKKEIDFGLAKAKYGISDIPIWAGAKYYFGGEPDGVYGAGELGLNMLTVSAEIPAQDFGGFSIPATEASESETKFGANVGAGFKTGPLDIRASLAILDLGHAGETMGVLANIGYNFAQF